MADLLFIIALVKYVYTFHALLELSHFLLDVISDCVRIDQVRVLRIAGSQARTGARASVMTLQSLSLVAWPLIRARVGLNIAPTPCEKTPGRSSNLR